MSFDMLERVALHLESREIDWQPMDRGRDMLLQVNCNRFTSFRRQRLTRPEALEDRCLLTSSNADLPLIQPTDLQYVGAFRVPAEYSYGSGELGGGLAYNPAHDSLYMVGHLQQQKVGEISVPEIRNVNDVSQLARATVLQPVQDISSRVPNWTLPTLGSESSRIGDFLVLENELIVSAFEYYDADANTVDSHFRLSSHDLSAATGSGLFQVGDRGGGFVGGYMAEIPVEWQEPLGSKYMTGLSSVPIAARTSAGPAAFGFDPDNFNANPTPATPFVYYPLDTPLGPGLHQQYQQSDDHGYGRARQEIPPHAPGPVDRACLVQPVGHDHDIGQQEDPADKTDHEELSDA